MCRCPLIVVCLLLLPLGLVADDVEDDTQASPDQVAWHPTEQRMIRELFAVGATCNVNPHGRVLHLFSSSEKPLNDKVLGLLDGADALRGIWLSNATDAMLARLETVSLPRIEQLNLTESPITDASLRQFARFPTLQCSNLERTRITDQGLRFLEGMPNLTLLRLNGTAITDAGLKSLTTLPKLQHLEFEDTAITDRGLAHLAEIPTLKTLYLRRTRVTDDGLSRLQPLPQLWALALDGTAITDRGLAQFAEQGGLQNVNHLYLSNTAVTDQGVLHLDKIPHLQGISLDGTQVTSASLKRLKQRPELYWITP